MVFGSKFRIRRHNSKASYLPRQGHEKLNAADPDHGSYKLMLTSNEDLVASAGGLHHHQQQQQQQQQQHQKPPSYELVVSSLGHSGKLANNLPDVLPLGAKLIQQTQPDSPTLASVSEVQLRYGSNGSLPHSPTHPGGGGHFTLLYSPSAQQRYSTPAAITMNGNFGNLNRSQSYDASNLGNESPTRYSSQSALSLKKTGYGLETTFEEPNSSIGSCSKNVSPAQSDCSLNSTTTLSSHSKSNYSTAESTDSGSALALVRNHATQQEQQQQQQQRASLTEGRIFRAELINTSLPEATHKYRSSAHRPESLRENIEKITQLQSKLMSAHSFESGLPFGHSLGTTKPATVTSGSCPTVNLASPSSRMPNVEPDLKEELLCDLEISIKDVNTEPDNTLNSEEQQHAHAKLVDVASQTDDLSDCDMGRLALLQCTKDEEHCRSAVRNADDSQQQQQQHSIELDYEKLAKELINLLTPNDRLTDILTPKTYKQTADYVSNLYNPDVRVRPAKRDVGTSTLMRMKAREQEPPPSIVAVELQLAEIDISLSVDGSQDDDSDSINLIKDKVQALIAQINRKIRMLKQEQQFICEECAANDQLGVDLLTKLGDKVRPSEATKFRTYFDDVGHITSLLLSLSERLAKTECSLDALTANNTSPDKAQLITKRERLFEQLDEAKRLKAEFDRRGGGLASLLEKRLSADDRVDYDYFVNMKAKLISDARSIANKLKTSEEQLGALRETLSQSEC